MTRTMQRGALDGAERFDRSYYESSYRDYRRQTPRRKLDAYMRVITRAGWPTPAGRRPRILDVGCAFGDFLAVARDRFEPFGTDLSEDATADAREALPAATICPGGIEAVGTTPLVGPFEVVTALDVLEHLDRPGEALDRIGRVLVPGGLVLVVVPVYDGPLGWLVRRLDRDPTHVQKHGRAYWISLVEQRFELVEIRGVFRYLLGGRFYVHFTGRALAPVSPALILAARRPLQASDR